ncbi:hypothetical protein CAPTEDRAFT_202823 [Capitella teleta]|uniref:Arsenite methyltransferase n=1 Tax=Capitella teleta TaxID=283909 RepID=R7USS9_CAPTE|nr:hypothetical protein CAPTEDRAFT_202823 [Capitella teleta]|eukprot:ELU09208.1 hypothetical protein CAPTEDRAFT_202823 [Capitella teleta]
MSCKGSQPSGCCAPKAECPPEKTSCCGGQEPKPSAVHDQVKDYYGKRVVTGDDLQTNVCLMAKTKKPAYIREALAMIHDEVQSKYYGCGLIAPEALPGCSILDLGSGAGMDCFVLSKLVGPNGHVTGLDMTDEQASLDVANKHIAYHMEKFGYKEPNVNFIKGYIEKMVAAGLKPNSFDIIVSNCVINLCPDKRPVLSDAYAVLKEGGELYFSDVYSDKVVPEEIRKNEILWGECIAGALYWRELYQYAKEVGFTEPFLVEASEFSFRDNSWKDMLGQDGYGFLSANYRLFKLPAEAKDCKSMSATYLGGIQACEEVFALDYKYKFKKNEALVVPPHVTAVLMYSRFKNFFKLEETTEIAKKGCGLPDPFQLARSGDIELKKGCC